MEYAHVGSDNSLSISGKFSAFMGSTIKFHLRLLGNFY